MKHYLLTETLIAGEDSTDSLLLAKLPDDSTLEDVEQLWRDGLCIEDDSLSIETNYGGMYELTSIRDISQEDFVVLYKYITVI